MLLGSWKVLEFFVTKRVGTLAYISVFEQYKLVSVEGWLCCTAQRINVGLSESTGSHPHFPPARPMLTLIPGIHVCTVKPPYADTA